MTTVAAHYQDDLRNLDPKRFSDLGPEWFWEDTLEVPKPTYWAAEYAAEVVRLRADGMTIEKLAAHFGKTPPTIRKALRIGAKARPEQQLPRKIARPRWAEAHAAEVINLKQQGMTTDEIAARLGKSDTTIRAALKHASNTGIAQGQSKAGRNASVVQGNAEAPSASDVFALVAVPITGDRSHLFSYGSAITTWPERLFCDEIR